MLQNAIEAERLPNGIVITEGRLAKLYGTSRTPVRAALTNLEEQGLLERLDGRGFAVRKYAFDQVVRQTVTEEMLGLGQTDLQLRSVTSQRIESDADAVLVQALPFGQFAISEQAMADHYGVSRTVVRELLPRLQSRGLVRKDDRSHWSLGPLTSREVAQFYALRAKLEPLALIESAPKFGRNDILSMWERSEQGYENSAKLIASELEKLEEDIHVQLLSKSANAHLLRMVRESQQALVVNRVFASFVGTAPFDISLREHSIVLEFIMRGAVEMAATALEEHINLAARRTRQRLMTLSVVPEPEFPEYLMKIGP